MVGEGELCSGNLRLLHPFFVSIIQYDRQEFHDCHIGGDYGCTPYPSPFQLEIKANKLWAYI